MAASPDYKAQQWITGIGSLGGRRAQLRKNAGLLTFDGAEAPYLLLVTLTYTNLGGDGRPSDEAESARLDASEVRIADALQAHFGAYYALCITSNGTRDLFFFHAAPTNGEAADGVVKAAGPTVGYELTLVYDPEWRPYNGMLTDVPSLPQ